MRESRELQDKLKAIRAIAFDIDGVVTDGRIYYGPEGELVKAFNARDNIGLRLAQAAGWKLIALSGRDAAPANRWAADFGLDKIIGGAKDKRGLLTAAAAELKLELATTAFLGDDLIDLPAMDLCVLSAAPADAALAVRRQVDLVLELPGGHGPLRELVDRALEAQGRTAEVVAAYLKSCDCVEPGRLVPGAAETDPKIGFRR